MWMTNSCDHIEHVPLKEEMRHETSDGSDGGSNREQKSEPQTV